jgi:rsbT antagonist protein RsbS
MIMEHEISRLPIIKIWDQILVPLQGEVTDRLAERLSQEVLDAVHEHGAAGLVIDVTGVWMIDSHLCAVLSHLASCARLMGTRTIISGLSPEIALTLQTMGVELQSMQTALTVEQALEMLGLRVVRPGQKKASAASASAQDDGPRDRSDLSFEGSAGDSMELTAQPFSLASRNIDRAPTTTRPRR